ncbi:MAG: amino acid aminotransferase [Janthinobacterium sp.]
MTNPTVSASLFSAIEMAPRDPILGITEAFNADQNPAKINLGVGVYYDDNGKVPLLACVRKAEAILIEQAAPRTYLPIEGLAAYDKAVQELVFGADSAVIQERRAVTSQTVGGSGALRVGADLLKRLLPHATIAISNPSWENHRAVFGAAGFDVVDYTYYDNAAHGLDFAGMLADLQKLQPGTVVLLHACCHNPTGADLSTEQWKQVAALMKDRQLFPFIDMAYQGFDKGITEDGQAVRIVADAGIDSFIVANSYSKSFSLYGERVGALSVVASSADEAARLLSQLKRVVRTNYSNPPTHGGKVVATVLATPELRQLWEEELAGMRVRIREMRNAFVEKLKAKAPGHDFEFVRQQIGMFSYSGLTKEQVASLREQSIYAVDTGRICVAALNSRNIDIVIDAIAKVL